VLILLLGVAAPLLPISGRIDPLVETPFATGFYLVESLVRLRLALLADLLAHLVLPATALALPSPRSSPACSNPPSPRR